MSPFPIWERIFSVKGYKQIPSGSSLCGTLDDRPEIYTDQKPVIRKEGMISRQCDNFVTPQIAGKSTTPHVVHILLLRSVRTLDCPSMTGVGNCSRDMEWLPIKRGKKYKGEIQKGGKNSANLISEFASETFFFDSIVISLHRSKNTTFFPKPHVLT